MVVDIGCGIPKNHRVIRYTDVVFNELRFNFEEEQNKSEDENIVIEDDFSEEKRIICESKSTDNKESIRSVEELNKKERQLEE